jgi:HEAT repeat protein
LKSPNADVRWAAIYALSLIVTKTDAEGVSALKASLDSTDLDEQLAAAGGLVAVGEKAAVPVLIALLESSENTQYIVTPAWRMARGLLLVHVAQDFGLREADDRPRAAAAKPAWQAWWVERGASLSWDPKVGKFQ